MMVAATGASAATKTFEATVTNVTGDAELIAELFGTSTDRTLKLRATFETDVSTGASTSSGSDYLRSSYDAFSLIAPETTINAPAGDSNLHRVYTRDADTFSNDFIQVGSFLGSTDPAQYDRFYLSAIDNDRSTWSRSNPISASILNSFSIQSFRYEKYVTVNDSNVYQSVRSSNFTWAEVSAVPLPAGLPLLLAGLGALGIASRRRRS
ncbi:MAG: VPLPA-CTERM sorting domain-containing protein [Tateyamaria sp.]|uniref:VPLPA-CTERM sorting domain-containing protein n=1 Tax=Tateyamaria sp. TaxID=1929288 RepID=UPI0032A0DE75